LADGAILVRGDRIVAVGPRGSIKLPAGTKILNCTGLTVTAGFQNSHVHFLEEKWNDTGSKPAAELAQHLRDMLTAYGFTTVVDTASDLANTAAIRSRVESGEIPGPTVLTAGGALFPPDGIPFYLRSYPEEMLKRLYQPATPETAVELVKQNLDGGADVTKLVAGSLMTPFQVKPMPLPIARAAAEETHRRGKLVMSHPSNHEGIQVSLDSGVDILVHTTAGAGPWPPELIAAIKQQAVSVIPTLKLWGYEMAKARVPADAAARFVDDGVHQLQAFVAAGGDVLFGTDVGYVQEYDTTDEYALMSKAGMTPMQILASLTVAPARKFGDEQRRGKVAPGMQADLVVLSADPAADVSRFAKVRYTIRKGEIVYSSVK
jgi:imidazolonepropionase-like amidohydrolase